MLNIRSIGCNLLQERCYVVWREAGRCVLVDPGCYGADDLETLEDLLTEEHLTPEAILLTHAHFDHIFGVKPLQDRFGGIPVYLHPAERVILDYSADMADRLALTPPDVTFTWTPLAEGPLTVAGMTFEVIHTPGHTPGNAMFWLPDRKIMFTGDHVLFDITPNITFWPEYDNALQHYLDSLEYAKRFPVALALPGHRAPGDYHARIDRILLHHEHRLAEIERIVGDEPGLTAYEITRRMRWRIHLDENGNFPPAQMWFAAGECMSHLDKLVADGRMRRIEGAPYVTYRLP